MSYKNGQLQCDMDRDCAGAITHLDKSGFVYCAPHGERRKQARRNCRKLRSYEIKTLERGEALKRY